MIKRASLAIFALRYRNNIPWIPRNRAYEYSATYTPVTYVYIYFWIKNPEEKRSFKSKFGPRRKSWSCFDGSFLDAMIVYERTKIQNGKRINKKRKIWRLHSIKELERVKKYYDDDSFLFLFIIFREIDSIIGIVDYTSRSFSFNDLWREKSPLSIVIADSASRINEMKME